jgi:hypothetical protein
MIISVFRIRIQSGQWNPDPDPDPGKIEKVRNFMFEVLDVLV